MIINTTKIRVRYADTDKMGIAYYSKYFEWFECGRTELLRQMGTPYSKMEKTGILLPVVEAYCRYRMPATYDDLVVIRTFLKEIPKAKIRLDYQVFDEKEARLLAEGYTVHSFIKNGNRPLRAPEDFINVVKNHF